MSDIGGSIFLTNMNTGNAIPVTNAIGGVSSISNNTNLRKMVIFEPVGGNITYPTVYSGENFIPYYNSSGSLSKLT